MALVTKRYIVSGRVQGVWFRASTQNQARKQGLTGWVRNLCDGRVEAVVSGDAEPMLAFEQWIQCGPQLAKVESVIVEDCQPERFEGFSIR